MAPNRSGSKYPTVGQISQSAMEQLRYNDLSKSDKVVSGIIPIPFLVIADAQTATYVGNGKVLRVFGNGAAYIHFGDSAVTVPDINSQDAILTPNTQFFTVATEDYVRTSAAIRLEVIAD